jgi:predicted HicB family RNase H-like nuclease
MLRTFAENSRSTARELTQAFRESIDRYLKFCIETGQKPDRPFNGKILLRTEPELHRKAALRAAVEGVSLSRWISHCAAYGQPQPVPQAARAFQPSRCRRR